MARGRAHALATAIAGGVISPSLTILGGLPWQQSAAFAVGCLSGLIINPDLDIRHFTHAEGVMRRTGGRLGWLLSGLWYTLWFPYAQLIPWHRHPISHLPIIGTAGRLLYLGIIVFITRWLAGFVFVLPEFAPPGPLFWWGVAGLAAMDALHALMDKI